MNLFKLIFTSKKTLLSDLELVLNNKFKIPSRGKTKKEKFADIIDIIKHIKDNNLDKLMPSYVALKLNNLPKNALNDSNNENILDKINEIKCLIVQLDNKLAMLNVHSNVSLLEHTHSTNWAECVPNADCAIKTTQPVIAIHNTNVNSDIQQTKNGLSNSNLSNLSVNKLDNMNKVSVLNNLPLIDNSNVESPNEDDYTTVSSRRKKQQHNNNFDKTETKTEANTKPKRMKIVGKLISDSTEFRAKRTITKKRVFCIKNTNDANAKTISNYLTNRGINVISIFPVLSKDLKDSLSIGTDLSSLPTGTFRLCINKEDTNKILNTNLWPSSIVIESWLFKKSSPVIENSKNNVTNEIIQTHNSSIVNNKIDDNNQSKSQISNDPNVDN